MIMPKLTMSIEGQRLEGLGFRRIPNSRSTYWKLDGGTELCVARLGQGEKYCDFDVEQVPDEDEEILAWGDEMAMSIAADRNFKWRK